VLKKLVVEFKDELDALGVKVDSLDSRVAVLEEDLGGWKIAGDFRFDYSDFDSNTGLYSSNLSHYDGISTSPSLRKTILTVDQKATGFSSF